MAIPAFILDAPPPPAGPRVGLFTAATGPMDMPTHVQTSGATWWSEVCGSTHLYPPACVSPPYQAFTVDASDGLITAYPFVVYASEVCPPVGSTDEDAIRRVRQRFTLGEQYAVEKALWGGGEGVTGIFETLNTAGKVTQLATSSSVIEAVSLLEQQAATSKYNGPLLIHARPRMAAYLGSKGTLVRGPRTGDGLHIYSQYGSEFVFGAGYSGNKWDGTPPDATTETMYITGRVLLWREPEIFVTPPDQMLGTAAGNAGTNQRTVIASRAWAVGVECLTAATVVTRAG